MTELLGFNQKFTLTRPLLTATNKAIQLEYTDKKQIDYLADLKERQRESITIEHHYTKAYRPSK